MSEGPRTPYEVLAVRLGMACQILFGTSDVEHARLREAHARWERDRINLADATPPRAEVDVPSDGTRERLTGLFDKLERQLDVDDDDAWVLDRTDIEWVRRALSRATGGNDAT